MAELPLDDAQRLIGAIVELTSMMDRALPRTRSSPMVQRLQAHLGVHDSVPNTSATFDPIEHANLQLALNELQSSAASWHELGLAPDIGNYGGVSLTSLLAGSLHAPEETARQFASIDVSATETIRCLRSGVVLTEFQGVPVAAMLYLTEHGRPALVVEVAAPTQQGADGFLARLRELMSANNVLRGKVVTFSFSEYGGFGLSFTTVPDVQRHQVILPGWQLDAIEEHALWISEVRDQLLAAGQHIKRGLLLYGPPGTGKTHTVSYLLGQMSNRTTIILSGASVGAVGQAGTLARKLAPATIVIEDVDLIGMDRGLPGGRHNPLLFQLLNEMDGLQADDDVLFILTTNRADLLEPALAARPGRVDQAIAIDVPDDDGRRALFELYLGTPIEAAAMQRVCDRTAGVAAAFIKEVARRATLRTIRLNEDMSSAVERAVADLFDTSTPLLKRSLAATTAAPTASPGHDDIDDEE